MSSVDSSPESDGEAPVSMRSTGSPPGSTGGDGGAAVPEIVSEKYSSDALVFDASLGNRED